MKKDPLKLKTHLQEILDGESVYCGIEAAIDQIPFNYWGKKRKPLPYTLYDLFEHLRLTNRDFLQYLTSDHYQTLKWPDDYWPKTHKPNNAEEMEKNKENFFQDLKAIKKLLKTKSLLEPLAHHRQHTLAREVMLLSNHMAYHTGQIIALRRLLGIW